MNTAHYRVLDPSEYFLEHLKRGLRPDGRSLTEFRSVSLQTNLINSAHGSALVRLGDAVVIASVKGEIVDERKVFSSAPSDDFSTQKVNEKVVIKKGRATICIEGQPHFNDINNNEVSKTTSILQNLFDENKLVDLNDLSIGKDKNVYWILYVDLVVLNCDGALLDACLLAVVAALRSTTLPSVTLVPEEDISEQIDCTIAQRLFPDKICVADACRPVKCVGKTPITSCSFLLADADNFDDRMLQQEECSTKSKHQDYNTFITSDPVEFERNLFPNNILTVIIGDSTHGGKPCLHGIYKYGGTCCVDDRIFDECCSLATKRKLQLNKLLNDALVNGD